ncbi:MAG TPA: hypothetical protein VHM30_01740, partial [Gemmatimonadaceae bacterium]|nr:hypothetical protein [Gemmatimonadaceae bacterium]
MRYAIVALLPLLACRQANESAYPAEADRLPTGRYLDPAVQSTTLAGSFPLGVVTRNGGREVAMLLSGYRTNGVQILDRATGRSTVLRQRAAFAGLALAPDGRTLYASGGNQDVVY